MSFKSVTSTNPIKKEIVEAIRKHVGFRCKVTCVKESITHIQGHAQKFIREKGCYESLGIIELGKKEHINE